MSAPLRQATSSLFCQPGNVCKWSDNKILSSSFRPPWPYRYFSSSRHIFYRYRPPAPPPKNRQFLSFLDKIPHKIVFYGIIGLNSAVFVCWFLATKKFKQLREPFALVWMEQNFTNSWKNLTSGRFWTPLTACFSHRDISHIALNGFTFFFMAEPVLRLLGSRHFIFLYLGGGIFASLTSIFYAKWSDKGNYSSHGASGAIYSIISLLACVAPNMTFQLYGIIPIPAWLVVSGLFAYDFYSTVSRKAGQTDTVGHLGGLSAGIGYFLFRYFRLF